MDKKKGLDRLMRFNKNPPKKIRFVTKALEEFNSDMLEGMKEETTKMKRSMLKKNKKLLKKMHELKAEINSLKKERLQWLEYEKEKDTIMRKTWKKKHPSRLVN
ncbi:hypothetical protein L6452_22305 [Arctium lappa]|uniref:Uncharacterized protein n=1 Tax=Arctium lappa TaxID=4217 RepID=A0ACB9AZF6_ARCLA|nr:hypothetical protein L6452_22305 [Arctium lappa]